MGVSKRGKKRKSAFTPQSWTLLYTVRFCTAHQNKWYNVLQLLHIYCHVKTVELTLLLLWFLHTFLWNQCSCIVVTTSVLKQLALYSGSPSSGSDVSTQTQLLSTCTHSLFLRAREPVWRNFSWRARFRTAFGKQAYYVTARRW